MTEDILMRFLAIITISIILVGCAKVPGLQDEDVYTPNNEIVQEQAEPATSEQSNDEFSEKYPFNNKVAIGDFEWMGRVLEPDNAPEGYPTYQLVKADMKGNETIMYESQLKSLYPAISLKVGDKLSGNSLILEHYKGYPEGGDATTVYYLDGKEFIRSTYSHWWGFIQELSIQYPDSDNYKINLVTSNDCKNYLDQTQPPEEEITTYILGLKITSENYEQVFNPQEPILASCLNVDSSIMPPDLRTADVSLHYDGITINLPGNARAYISRDENTKELSVSY